MGISDMFKVNQYKNELEQLKAQNQYLMSQLSPENKDIMRLRQELSNLNETLNKISQDINTKNQELYYINNIINQKNQELIILDDELLYQNFGVYTPLYNLMSSDDYKNRIDTVRGYQKNLIKQNSAVLFPNNWTVNGDLKAGKKMISDNVKQIMRSFNNECDILIDKVKYNNIDSIRKRIQKSFEDLNKLNQAMNISITTNYLHSKLEELTLCHEYAIKKQDEKEEVKRIREEQRESQQLQKELDESRKVHYKEQRHYLNALTKIETQIKNASGSELEVLLEKQNDIKSHLEEIEITLKDIDYREANQRAGYVYIISNIGSFGEDIFKIGMTRRLEPQDRVDELGDASVPFNFDVHAMIFSDDAPSLENALHKAFEHKKINMVNRRREFFNVTLDEIKDVIRKNHDKTVDFITSADASQYRETMMLKSNNLYNSGGIANEM